MEKTYSPRACVECGSPTVPPGLAEVKLDINGTVRRIAALYRCLKCQALVDAGLLASNITPEVALAWLTGEFIPRAYANVVMGTVGEKYQDRAEAILAEAVETANELALAMYGQPSGPDEPLTRAEAQRVIDAVADSLRMEDDGTTTFLCPNCDNRHDAEHLFKMLENAA